MKGLYVAVGVLLAMAIVISWNAAYVHRTTNDLIERLETLPDKPDPETTPDQIVALREQLESHITLLGLSVSYAVIDRTQEALYTIEAYARTGDEEQYRTSLAVLYDLFRDIKRLERFKAENILRLMPPMGHEPFFMD